MFTLYVDMPGIFSINQTGILLQKIGVTNAGIVFLKIVPGAGSGKVTADRKVCICFILNDCNGNLWFPVAGEGGIAAKQIKIITHSAFVNKECAIGKTTEAKMISGSL